MTANQGKGRASHLPKRVWDAILAYLQVDGRYKPGGPVPGQEMFVWQAIRHHGSQNLVVQRYLVAGHEPDQAQALAKEQMSQAANKPIVRSTATEILRRHLRRYYAYELHRDGMSKSEARVSRQAAGHGLSSALVAPYLCQHAGCGIGR